MIQNVFCDIYSSIRDKNSFLSKIRFYSLLRWFTRRIANVILPVVWRIQPTKIHIHDHRQPRIIVSLTTFPARIDKVWLVIESILRQTVIPDKIILWLSQNQYSSSDQLPSSLLRLQTNGLEIKFMPDDLRSHKKYTYTFREFPDDIVITIDDDIIYRSTMVEELLERHHQYPHAVIAHYTHNILFEKDGTLKPYCQWENNAMHGSHLFFGSGGGTLFPPHALHQQVTDIVTAMRICPNADDIWLNAMVRLNGREIVHTHRHIQVLPILNVHAHALSAHNITEGNDKQIRQMTKYCIENYHTNPFKQ